MESDLPHLKFYDGIRIQKLSDEELKDCVVIYFKANWAKVEIYGRNFFV